MSCICSFDKGLLSVEYMLRTVLGPGTGVSETDTAAVLQDRSGIDYSAPRFLPD